MVFSPCFGLRTPMKMCESHKLVAPSPNVPIRSVRAENVRVGIENTDPRNS